MSGGEIKNVLTLDVSKFESAVKKATGQLDKLDSRLDKAAKVAAQLDKGVNALSSGLDSASSNFQVLDRVVGQVNRRMGAQASSMEKVSKASRKTSAQLSKMVASAEKLETVSEWTAHYGKALDKLNPLIGKLSKSHAQLDKEFKAQAKNANASAEQVASARVKVLAAERNTNKELIADRKKMIEQLAKIEERASLTASLNQGRARYLRKSSPERIELDSQSAAMRAEASAAAAQRGHIQAIVKELEWKNRELRAGVVQSMREVQVQRELVALEQRRAAEAKKRTDQDKANKQLEAEVARSEAAAQKKLAAERKALSAIDKERDRAAAREEKRIRDAEKQRIAAAKRAAAAEKAAAAETAAMWKSVGTMYAGVQAARGVQGGVNAISEYELANKRVDMFNLPEAERQRFGDKARALTDENQLMTQKDSILLRTDALSALGYNNEKIIDELMPIASKAATSLNALGYDKGDPSTIMKNLWGVIEMLGQQYDPAEAKETIDLLFKSAVVSGGKVTIQDIETFLRNSGAAGRSMTTEGLASSIPMLEMFKTAGGGSGGGSGVARVGTMVKMMSAYANGKSLKNEGVDQLLGSGVLNAEFDSMTVEQFREVEKKNIEMMKQLKIAGFKDVDKLVENPMEFMQSLREPLLKFMTKPENFAKYFAGREKFSYAANGDMLDKSGKTVGLKDQDRIEAGAFAKFFNGMGVSQNMIDGAQVNLQRSSIIRSEHIKTQIEEAARVEEAFNKIMDTWSANTLKLKAAAMDLAVQFEPVLDLAGKFVSWSADILNSLTSVMQGDNGFAKFITVFGLLGAAVGLAMRPVRMLIGLFQSIGGSKKAVDGVAGAIAGVGNAAKPAAGLLSKLFGAGLLSNASSFFGLMKGGPALLAGLRVGVTLLGGPLGILASALITGASLWDGWGDAAKRALNMVPQGTQLLVNAKDGFGDVQKLAGEVEQDVSKAIGKLPMLEAQRAMQVEAYKEARSRDDKINEKDGGNEVSAQSKMIIGRISKIDNLIAIAKKQEAAKKESKGEVGKSDQANVVKVPAGGAGRGGSGAGGKGVRQDAFQISLEKLRGDADLAKLETEGISSGAMDYDKMAEVAFKKAWMTGAFDTGKRENLRPFANRAYDEERGWQVGDIDMAGAKKSGSVQDWMAEWKRSEIAKDTQAAVSFAQGKAASAAQGVTEAFENLQRGTEGQTDAFVGLTREFARFEAKTPGVAQNKDYATAKQNALTNQASMDAMAVGQAIKSNAATKAIDFSDVSDFRKQIEHAKLAAKLESDRLQAVEDSLRKQIKAHEDAGDKSSEAYTNAVRILGEMTPLYEQQREILLKTVQEAKKTAVQKTFDQWSKLEGQYNQMAVSWTNNIADTLAGVLTGKDKIDVRGFLSTVTGDLSGMFLRAGMAELNKGVFGGASFFEQSKSLMSGTGIENGGWLGGKLNEWRGLGTKGDLMGPAAPATTMLDNMMNDLSASLGGIGGKLDSFVTSLTSNLGSAFDWVKDGLGDFTAGLFEGDSALGDFVGSLMNDVMGALKGLFSGGSGGGSSGFGEMASAAASWIGSFFAKGGAFGGSGLSAFAKGGAFTNGVYNSPTLFKFAKGGNFANGVMGEAGPEAVMPLSRDSSGRLGVNVNSGSAGGGTNVAITINVASDGGSSEQSAGQDGETWKMLAQRVKGVVVQEIVNQKRPGGALSGA